MRAILRVEGVTKRFGGLVALRDVTLEVEEGQIFGLIGPNGAGKTTFVDVVCGFHKPDSGRIWFRENEITGLPPWTICKLGIGRTFQIPRPFRNMTVRETIMVGLIFGKDGRLSQLEKRANDILEFVEFALPPDTVVGQLNTAQLRRVELARALASGCELLLLDETAAGLTPVELAGLMSIIRKIRDSGRTVLTIEHQMRVIVSICDRLAVLNFGEKMAEGPVRDVLSNERVIEAYLGERFLP